MSDSETPSEHDLMVSAQAGDADAFEALVQRHIGAVRAFLALRAPAKHLVDELAHETFIVAYDKLDQFTPGTELGAWLRTIAGHLLRAAVQRFARQQRNNMQLRERMLVERAEAPLRDRGDVAIALEAAIEELPEDLRSLLNLRYQEELDSNSIAERLGRSPAWVRTTLFRARERLRQRVSHLLGGDSQ